MHAATTAEIRAWAQANGYAVGDRGRLPAEVSEAFYAATPSPKHRSSAKATPTRPTSTRTSSTVDGQSGLPPQEPAESVGAEATNVDEILGRISTLERQMAALTSRLEAADPSQSASARRRRFGRRS